MNPYGQYRPSRRRAAPSKYWGLCVLAVLFAAGIELRAQQSPTMSLAVRAGPEAHVTPGRVSLRFVISPDGVPVALQTVVISAWVRALPGERILLSARSSGDLKGDSVSVPISAVQWAGVLTRSVTGAETARCNGGYLNRDSSVELVAGWLRSGILTCQATFSPYSHARLLWSSCFGT